MISLCQWLIWKYLPRETMTTWMTYELCFLRCCGHALVSMRVRIRILVKLLVTKIWICTRKMSYKQVIGRKTYLQRYKSIFERYDETRYIYLFWSFSLLLDPDPHSQYGCAQGSRKAKAMRIRVQIAYFLSQRGVKYRYQKLWELKKWMRKVILRPRN